MPSPEEVSDFDKELALVQLIGYMKLTADKMAEIRGQLDQIAEVMKRLSDQEGYGQEGYGHE